MINNIFIKGKEACLAAASFAILIPYNLLVLASFNRCIVTVAI